MCLIPGGFVLAPVALFMGFLGLKESGSTKLGRQESFLAIVIAGLSLAGYGLLLVLYADALSVW